MIYGKIGKFINASLLILYLVTNHNIVIKMNNVTRPKDAHRL